MRTTRVRTTSEGTMKLSASIFMIFNGNSLSRDGLLSNPMNSVLGAGSFKRIDALQLWISRMQSINLDLALPLWWCPSWKIWCTVECHLRIVDCDSMAVGYSGYVRSIEDEEEGPRIDHCIGGSYSCVTTLRGLRCVYWRHVRRASRGMRDWLDQRGRDLVFWFNDEWWHVCVFLEEFLISVICWWAWRELVQKHGEELYT